jgi:hypothetical protein
MSFSNDAQVSLVCNGHLIDCGWVGDIDADPEIAGIGVCAGISFWFSNGRNCTSYSGNIKERNCLTMQFRL